MILYLLSLFQIKGVFSVHDLEEKSTSFVFAIVCYFIILVFEEFSYFIVSLLIFSLIDVDRYLI